MAPTRSSAIKIATPAALPDCLLFALPPELRTIIFELVVQDSPADHAYHLKCRDRDHEIRCAAAQASPGEIPVPTYGARYLEKKNCRRWRQRFAFLLSCRAIYHEACAIHFNQHTIGLGVYCKRQSLVRFLREHSPQRLAGVQRLEVIVLTGKAVTKVVRLMRHLPRLTFVRLVVGNGYPDNEFRVRRGRVLQGQREQSGVLFNWWLRMEQKTLKRAIREVKSLTRLELHIEDIWFFTADDRSRFREMEKVLNESLKSRVV